MTPELKRQITYMENDEETELYRKLGRAIAVIEQCNEFTFIIPEVRTNLVYAPIHANKPEHVL